MKNPFLYVSLCVWFYGFTRLSKLVKTSASTFLTATMLTCTIRAEKMVKWPSKLQVNWVHHQVDSVLFTQHCYTTKVISWWHLEKVQIKDCHCHLITMEACDHFSMLPLTNTCLVMSISFLSHLTFHLGRHTNRQTDDTINIFQFNNTWKQLNSHT